MVRFDNLFKSSCLLWNGSDADACPVHAHAGRLPGIIGEQEMLIICDADGRVSKAPLTHVLPILSKIDILQALREFGLFRMGVDDLGGSLRPGRSLVGRQPQCQVIGLAASDDKGDQAAVRQPIRSGDLAGNSRGYGRLGRLVEVQDRSALEVDIKVLFGLQIVGPEHCHILAGMGASAQALIPEIAAAG